MSLKGLLLPIYQSNKFFSYHSHGKISISCKISHKALMNFQLSTPKVVLIGLGTTAVSQFPVFLCYDFPPQAIFFLPYLHNHLDIKLLLCNLKFLIT